MDWRKRCYCGHAAHKKPGETLHMVGWVDAIRDHGNLRFIHLRDASGTVQIVFDPNFSEASFEEAALLRPESVVDVSGTLRQREVGTENSQLETGSVEVVAVRLVVQNTCETLPFQVSEKDINATDGRSADRQQIDEELRLYHRYLDLRRPSVQHAFRMRHRMTRVMRATLEAAGFMELETPVLTRSTPEGARDFLVPSRSHQKKFYALPQSPQLFKQIFMIGGLERYYQIVRCFRDEDLRPNRQPEFTQLDLEASFIDEEFIQQLTEEIVCAAFQEAGHPLSRPFPTMPYATAMNLYGSDKPDLRPGMPFFEASDLFANTQYGIFRRIVQGGGSIKGILVKNCVNHFSKNELQNQYCQQIVPKLGGKGMTWMKVQSGSLQSNIVQFFSAAEQAALLERSNAEDGDVIMMIADLEASTVLNVLGKLRLHVAQDLKLSDPECFMPMWITDWPLFEKRDKGLHAVHHPFTSPMQPDFDPEDTEQLLKLTARAYDIVINGEELGGGSIRIHKPEIQKKLFKALGLSPEEQEQRFGFFLRALKYGAPPHGGLALGMDRLISMALGKPSIRDVITFPKNRSGSCPMTDSPSYVEDEQLKELHLLNTPAPKRRWVS